MNSKEWIRMADGTVIDNAYVVKMTADRIAIYAAWDSGFAGLYGIFGDPERTGHMHSFQYGDEQDWDGYTEPNSMTISDGTAVVVLDRA